MRPIIVPRLQPSAHAAGVEGAAFFFAMVRVPLHKKVVYLQNNTF
jgi:hypothetical protein